MVDGRTQAIDSTLIKANVSMVSLRVNLKITGQEYYNKLKIKSEEDKASKSLRPAAERLAELLGQDVKFIPETRGAELEAAIAELKDGEVLMFENTRFEDLDGKKESI